MSRHRGGGTRAPRRHAVTQAATVETGGIAAVTAQHEPWHEGQGEPGGPATYPAGVRLAVGAHQRVAEDVPIVGLDDSCIVPTRSEIPVEAQRLVPGQVGDRERQLAAQQKRRPEYGAHGIVIAAHEGAGSHVVTSSGALTRR